MITNEVVSEASNNDDNRLAPVMISNTKERNKVE